MKAVVYREKKGLVCDEVPMPEPKANQALVRVKNVGVCGSDLFFYKSGLLRDGYTLGHECSGTIAALGSEVEGWSEGDRVIIRPAGCGVCPYCKRDQANICPERRAIGMLPIQGAYAEYVAADKDMLIRMPEGLDFYRAALTDPIATSLHGINLSGCKAGNSAMVAGVGPVGLSAFLLLKKMGASPLIAVELSEERLALAEKLGADLALSPKDPAMRKKIKDAAGVDGPQYIFECAGAPASVETAIGLAARGGTIVVLSVCSKTVPILPLHFMQNQIGLIGSLANTHNECRHTMQMMADGELDVSPFLVDPVPLEKLPEEFMGLFENKSKIKVMAEI